MENTIELMREWVAQGGAIFAWRPCSFGRVLTGFDQPVTRQFMQHSGMSFFGLCAVVHGLVKLDDKLRFVVDGFTGTARIAEATSLLEALEITGEMAEVLLEFEWELRKREEVPTDRKWALVLLEKVEAEYKRLALTA